jgi:hypothetical protein
MAGPTIINLKQCTVKFAADAASITTAPDFTCQVTAVSIKANPKLQTVPATMCGGESQVPAATGWQLDITYLQDWGAVDSISQYFYDNDAELSNFEITPVDPSAPAATGTCYLVAGDYLGAAGTPLTGTSSCPCPAKPTITGSLTRQAQTGVPADQVPQPVQQPVPQPA